MGNTKSTPTRPMHPLAKSSNLEYSPPSFLTLPRNIRQKKKESIKTNNQATPLSINNKLIKAFKKTCKF